MTIKRLLTSFIILLLFLCVPLGFNVAKAERQVLTTEQYEQRINELANKITELLEEINAKDAELERLEAENSELTKDMETLRTERNEAQSVVKLLEELIDSDNITLKKENEQLKQRIEELQSSQPSEPEGLSKTEIIIICVGTAVAVLFISLIVVLRKS